MGVIHNTVPSPIGKLTIVVLDEHLIGVYQEGQPNYPSPEELGENDINDVVSETAKQLKEYFAGQRSVFELPLGDADTVFRDIVIKAVKQVPYGTTVTYSDIASLIGKPKSMLYIAGALNANKLTIVVPCHRVTGTKSSRYAGPVKNKEFLQKLEASNRSKFDPTAPKKIGFLARLLRKR